MTKEKGLKTKQQLNSHYCNHLENSQWDMYLLKETHPAAIIVCQPYL